MNGALLFENEALAVVRNQKMLRMRKKSARFANSRNWRTRIWHVGLNSKSYPKLGCGSRGLGTRSGHVPWAESAEGVLSNHAWRQCSQNVWPHVAAGGGGNPCGPNRLGTDPGLNPLRNETYCGQNMYEEVEAIPKKVWK